MRKLFLSLPLLTACLAQQLRADAVIVFNEIMYHPAANEPALEWVELRNALAVDVDISEWSLTGGINYTFPSNTFVRGRSFLVVAISPAAFTAATGVTNVLGPFTGRLGNNGDTLRLRNNSGRVMDEVTYGVEGDWPVAPDGSGVSLAKRDADSASAPAENWTVSERVGGTPNAANFLSGPPPETRLIAIDAPWKFEPTGAPFGNLTWTEPAFNDSGWSSRSAFTNRSLPTLFNTGIGNNGVALAAGVADPHYRLTAAAQGAVPTNAMAMANNAAWLANDASSVWIGVNNNGANNVAFGAYAYQTTFSLDGFPPSTVRIDVAVAVDNDLTNVLLNGVPTGLAASGFAGFNALGSLTGLAPGTNTLEFRTVNAGTTANPHGFRAAFTSSGLALLTNNPMPAGVVTHYLRKSFTFSGDPALTQLRINPVIADGAVVYLNGSEVYRQNLPGGVVDPATPASSDVASPGFSGSMTIPAGTLVAGPNVLAVELHQAAGSTDAPLFGCELISSPLPEPRPSLAFNEASATTNAVFWVELANHGPDPVPLDGFVIRRDGAVDNEYVFPAGPPLPARGFLAVSNSTLGFLPVDGDRLFLLPPTRGSVLDAIELTRGPRARATAGTGAWLRPNATTPGAANSFALRNEIVINEIMYNHALLPPLSSNSLPRESPEAWVELFNKSSNAVDLAGWELGGGISYLFTAGQSIPAGGYLVVADDVPFLRALHPGINIVGDFGGRLSGKSDRIVLRDPTGNPADEVRYYDGPPWPGYADGGGSSLELRDPNSDNSKAEAWAASDETGKTSWQTVSYRMVANIPSGSGQPTQWQDFILGLQSAGEVLIDDLSVIQAPAGTPIEITSNGNFESGLSGWRVLGTHNRSRVEPEPGNPGNNVLRLIATGAQEHMHNHIERTLNAGRTIANGTEYQISYRARWLAGNNLLNTRLYFNRSARTVALPMPALNGTPGAQNSRFEPNIGPTFSGFGHQPVVPQPGAPVTVNVVAQDPNGVASAEVVYSVNSGAWQNAPMTHQGGDVYTGNIPGQAAGAVVQFYARATDGLGAAALYPARGTNSGALYKVNDGQANLPLAHNVRVILTPDNINLLHGTSQGVNQTNVMSNDLLPCTVIYDESRAYYDCGVHLRGSQRGRYSDVRTGFHINFPLDDLFRGVHPVMLVDRSGAGDATANRQEEIVLKHILNRAGGIPGTYSEIARVLAPRAAHTGPVQFFPRHEDNFIETAFENGGDGQMWEMELIYFPTTANAAGYKNPQPDSVVGTDITNLGDDKEIYRYNHMIKNHRDVDDYRGMIALGKAWALPPGPALDAQTRALMDMDQFMRAYALVSLCSVGDMYTFGNNHNWFMYQRPSDGKFLYFPWDMDFAFTRGASGALVGDQNFAKVVNLPANLRCFYAHILDIINVSFNTNYMAYWVNHYATFAPGQNYINSSFNTIRDRVTFARNTINAQTGTNFTVNGGTTITTNSNLIILTGTAAAAIKTIRINGIKVPVTWTSVSAWRIAVAVTDATNVLNLAGYDIYDRPLSNFTRTVTVNYTGPAAPDPAGIVVINEIMYNPAFPDAAFIELFNTSATTSFDLSGWRINGLDYTFPPGSVITNRQYLVLAGNVPAYFAAHGTNVAIPFGQFAGNLQNDGETLTLLCPGVAPGEEIVVDKVRYEGRTPWITTPNGGGPSLQLIDPAQDHSRVGNWGDGAGWRLATFTGTIQGGASPGTNFLVFLASAGDVFIDDIVLVTGAEAGVGPNLIVNGGFESPLSGTWELLGNHTNSVVSTEVSHTGNASLRLVATGPGGSTSTMRQFIPALPASTVCTLSYWFLPSATASNLNIRTVPGSLFNSIVSVRPIFSSPGGPNAAASVLPPFPPLWLNEAQPENLTGPADGQGEREPWIELYNRGASVVRLAGCYLADNYSNITQWAFPPGASLQPGEFKLIFADGEPGESTASEWHTSFRLSAGSGEIALAWSPGGGAPQVLDYLTYTNILAGRSYGDFPDGQPFDRQEFYRVTPGGTNDNAAPPIVAYINEWMAANTSGLINTNNGNRFSDWFELYNPGDSSVNLAGHYLTDNLANRTQFLIPTGYVIPPRGFLLVWADERPNLNTNTDPALHVSFRLSENGDQIGLFAGDGTAIDTVDFLAEPQFNNLSHGRIPDATGPAYYLGLPTPLALNAAGTSRYLTLAPIPDAALVTGETLAFTATPIHSGSPAPAFTFSLGGGAPTGAVINAASGAFSWTPSPSQAPSTYLITVRVTDDGLPALSAARTFTARVRLGFRVTGIVRQPNGDIALAIGATVGKTYRVEYKNNLDDEQWTILPSAPPTVATSNTLTFTDNTGALPQRFYRVVQLD
jgi:hypothetical protein